MIGNLTFIQRSKVVRSANMSDSHKQVIEQSPMVSHAALSRFFGGVPSQESIRNYRTRLLNKR